MKLSSETKGVLLILLGTVSYGFDPAFVKAAFLYIPPLYFMGWSTIAAALIAMAAGRLHQDSLPKYSNQGYGTLLLIGVVGTTIPYVLISMGLPLTSASNAAILLKVEILYAILLGTLFLNETFTLLVKKFHKDTPPFLMVSIRTLIGGILLLVLQAVLYPPAFFLDSTLWSFAIFAILVEGGNTFVGIACWYFGIQYITLAKATAITIPSPVIAFLVSLPLLGEVTSPIQLISLAIVGVGLYLLVITRSSKKPSSENELS
ncbi:MAG: DMT family transporter [Candidatus Ranarchaeia archaeon]|jgi:drug/metabolite transporter (DMT)-like permease